MNVICKKRCFYGNREWLPGEIADVEGDKVPLHFAAVAEGADVKPHDVKRVTKPNLVETEETAAEKAQRGEAVAFSQLANTTSKGVAIQPKVKDPTEKSKLTQDDINSLL